MKPWTTYAAGFAAVASVTLASCGDDDGGDVPSIPTNDAPTVEIRRASDGTVVDTVMMLDPDALYEVDVVADDAQGNLRTVTISRDGTPVAVSGDNVFLGQIGPSGALTVNPELILTADSTGFERTYFLRTADDAETDVTYTFVVEDNGNDGAAAESAEASIVLVTREQLTPITDSTTNGIFYNASGQLPGAFDLDAGENVLSSSDLSELQDGGVDTSGTGEWRRVIIAENGAALRSLSVEDTTGFSYNGIEFQEEIRGLYERGSDATNNRVGPVDGGEILLVNRGDSIFWLVEVAEVTENPNDNSDGYLINYKMATPQ